MSLSLSPSLYGRNEPGFKIDFLATVYWAPSAQRGVTRQGVVLTYLLSFVIDSQETPTSAQGVVTRRGVVLTYLLSLVISSQ
jgi:hypothetical protein